jgi:hypothetical protein
MEENQASEARDDQINNPFTCANIPTQNTTTIKDMSFGGHLSKRPVKEQRLAVSVK